MACTPWCIGHFQLTPAKHHQKQLSYTDIVVGDEIVVYHDGNVMETDPLKVGTVHAITLKTPSDRTESEKHDKTFAEPTEDMSEIPGGARFIIKIRDRTEEEQLTCAEAEELFYEDETTEFPS